MKNCSSSLTVGEQQDQHRETISYLSCWGEKKGIRVCSVDEVVKKQTMVVGAGWGCKLVQEAEFDNT